MRSVLLLVAGIAMLLLGTSILIVASMAALNLVQRRGRWRGRSALGGMMFIIAFLSLIVGAALASISPRAQRISQGDLGAGALVLIGSVVAGLGTVIVARALPQRGRSGPRHARLRRLATAIIARASRLLYWAAAPLAVWFGWWGSGGKPWYQRPVDALIGGGALGVGVLLTAGWLEQLAARLPPAAIEAHPGNRPDTEPVMYLRAFAHEECSFAPDVAHQPRTFEEFMHEAVGRDLGQLVALGSPMDRLAPSGAQRIYATDAGWRDEAERLIRRSRCFLMVGTSTANVQWEVNTIGRLGLQDRLYILTPPGWVASHPVDAAGPHRARPRGVFRGIGLLWREALSRTFLLRDADPAVLDRVLQDVPTPLTLRPLDDPGLEELNAVLEAAGLGTVSGPVPHGGVIAFEQGQPCVLASGLTTPDEYTQAIAHSLAGRQPP